MIPRYDDEDVGPPTLVPCPRCVGPDDDPLDPDARPHDCQLCGDLRLVTTACRTMWIEASK